MKIKNSSRLMTGAKILFYTISVLCIITGLNYILRGDLMPYHYRYLGRSADQIEPRTLSLLISAARLIGGMMIGLGAAFGIMTRNIEKYRAVVLPGMTVLAGFPLAVAFLIVYSIGETVPMALVSVLIVLFTAGLIIMYLTGKE